MTRWLIVLAVVVLLWLIYEFNKLVRMRNLTKNAWADVDVYLKRRAELIPNLVEAVKAYASHEKTLLSALAAARSHAMAAGNDLPERSTAENEVGLELFRAIMLKEAYPELKANQTFLNLQEELSETESKIASARQYYNACVRDMNTMIESFPSSMMAAAMGLQQQRFFETETASEREAPQLGMV